MFGLLVSLQLSFRNQHVSLSSQISVLQQNIVAIRGRFESLKGKTGGGEFPEELIWKNASRADVELSLQKLAVDLATQSGMKIVTFGNSRVSYETHADTASFNIEVEGPLDGALMFLSKLEQQAPKVAVATLRIRPDRSQGSGETNVPVYLQVNLWAYWNGAT